MGRWVAGLALALLTAGAGGVARDARAEQACTTPVANPAFLGCGDANRGMVLYGQVPTATVTYTWACNQCHSNNPLTDKLNSPAPAPSLIRAAPRDPGYIDFMMHKQPDAEPIAFAMEACCVADRPPNNVMGDLGDIAEFLYTCKLGIAPCVVGGGGGGGGGSPGQLQGSGATDFGNQPTGSTSAPLTLTLSNVGGATVHIASVTSDNAAEFAITANTCTSLTQAAACTVKVAFSPAAPGARSAKIVVTSDGLYSPQSFTFTGTGTAGVANYGGIWWNAPSNSESGWGLNLAHQGDTIFASWFTYDTAGNGWWLVVTMNKTGENTYTGDLYTVAGTRFDAFNPANVIATKSGTATLTFTDASNGSFNYVIGSVNETKSITRQVFGTMPTCTFGAVADLTTATNYQDLWWNKPANSESGWGINLNHQGDTIFATWFTYDTGGQPLWLVVTAKKTGPGVYSGDLYRTSGARFDTFNPASVTATKVGTATFTFADGNDATFDYTVQLAGMAAPVHQQKQITREIFAAPGTTCK
jgi:hypothetical protein